MSLGRPRTFDIDTALDAAMHVFWLKGYEGASLPALTEAMGINRPSLYAAFGNKEELFRKALNRYMEQSTNFMRETLNIPNTRQAIESFLRGVVEACTDDDSPKGCLLVQGALACSETSESVRQELIARRGVSEHVIRQRIERGIAEGDVPKNEDAAKLATYLATLLHGMAVEAASGATEQQLNGIVDIVMRSWPEVSAQAA